MNSNPGAVFNASLDTEYHTQRNNAIIPHESCNTTSLVMALKQAGWDLPYPPEMQPEDYLTSKLLTREAYDEMRKIAPWTFGADDRPLYKPNEVHEMLVRAVNAWAGEEIDVFSTKWCIDTIIRALKEGSGIVLSGIFTVDGKSLHHMVSLAGFYRDLSAFIIDDPYGDFRTGYQDHHGNNIVVPEDDFISIFKPVGQLQKWAHIIKPSGKRSNK